MNRAVMDAFLEAMDPRRRKPRLFDQENPPRPREWIVASSGICAPFPVRPRPFNQDDQK